ncbi:hypothetical protein LG003_06955 [Photorhabdus kleinii]|uniref:hypothetical protein n=1 Tax=Photorhabdus kleinii TaxID=768034 RepID=UPI0021D4BAF7|nr:hypothetical protein [Photorhabdus kleinii]MCT8342615.1 hypothetical protein [Photorhabdus kleinii]
MDRKQSLRQRRRFSPLPRYLVFYTQSCTSITKRFNLKIDIFTETSSTLACLLMLD